MFLIFLLSVIALLIYIVKELYKQVNALRYCYIDMSDAYVSKIAELNEYADFIANKDADFDVNVLVNAVGAAEREWNLVLDKHLKEMKKANLPDFRAGEKGDYLLRRKS